MVNLASPKKHTLAHEIEALFLECVHAPVRVLRQQEIAQQQVQAATTRATIERSVRLKMPEMVALANRVGSVLFDAGKHHEAGSMGDQCSAKKALAQTLLCISDMLRYIDQFDQSAAYAELALAIDESDPRPLAKLALLEWESGVALKSPKQTGVCSRAGQFAHYIAAVFRACMLVSRELSPTHQHSTHVIQHYIEGIRDAHAEISDGEDGYGTHVSRFAATFVNAVWSIYDTNQSGKVAQEILQTCRVAKTFTQLLDAAPKCPSAVQEVRHMLFHVIGIAMFVRYSFLPLAGSGQAPNPQKAFMADELISELVVPLCNAVATEAHAVGQLAKRRRKNCIRYRQKKRRKARLRGHATGPDVLGPEDNLLIWCEGFRAQNMAWSFLQVLAPLAYFWSKTVDTHPGSRTYKYERCLDAVTRATRALDRIAKVSSTIVTSAMIQTMAMDEGRACLPPLEEDMVFRSFLPCDALGMFRRTKMPQLNLRAALCGKCPNVDVSKQTDEITAARSPEGTLWNACGYLGSATAAATRRCFTRRVVAEVVHDGNMRGKFAQDAIYFLTETSLRQLRLMRLRRKLSVLCGPRSNPITKSTESAGRVGCGTAAPSVGAAFEDGAQKGNGRDAVLTVVAAAEGEPHPRRCRKRRGEHTTLRIAKAQKCSGE